MRILYVVPYAPNPVRTRPYNLIRALSKSGHEVTVLTLAQDDTEMTGVTALSAGGVRVMVWPLPRGRSYANCAAALLGGEPLQAAYCWQPALAARLRELLQNEPFDVVHVEHLRGARYARLAKATLTAMSSPTPVVWDSVDCISHLFRQALVHSASPFGRFISRLDLPRTERYERQLVREFDAVLTTSPADRDALVELANEEGNTDAPVYVLPNGVDLDAFRPDPAIDREPATLILSGKMSYHANVTMVFYLVNEILPQVWERRPDVRLMIVGKDPPVDVRALASDPRVTVTGMVPDLRPFLNRATMAVAPMVYNAGIQNKLLEAMACGAPVVTTPNAIQGLAIEPGHHLLVGDGPSELAEAVHGLLERPERGQALSVAGREYVAHHHDWSEIGDRLTAIYDSVQTDYYIGKLSHQMGQS
jgi:sugar transferase (PEP-CTERM/EpsH1 system associated)